MSLSLDIAGELGDQCRRRGFGQLERRWSELGEPGQTVALQICGEPFCLFCSQKTLRRNLKMSKECVGVGTEEESGSPRH